MSKVRRPKSRTPEAIEPKGHAPNDANFKPESSSNRRAIQHPGVRKGK